MRDLRAGDVADSCAMKYPTHVVFGRALGALLILSLASAFGCSSSSTSSASDDPADSGSTALDDVQSAPDVGTAADTEAPDSTTPDADAGIDPGTLDPDKYTIFEAGPFEIPPGEERFYCYSHTLTEDIIATEIKIDSSPVVHHVVYSRTTSPDPAGFFECDVLFQNNWLPVFISGTGDASLIMPEGSGHVLKKGQQLTLQLHLLNTTLEPIAGMVPVGLKRSTATQVEPIATNVFGSVSIALPPNETTQVTSACDNDETVHMFSAFAHMHYLGRKMVVEAGPDPDSLTEVFRSDPYDFDEQTLVDMDLTLNAGDHVRVTCTYENYLDQFVTFGESSTSEMCFFIGFATGGGDDLGGCIGSDGGFLPPECGSDPANDIGLGEHCSKGGGECESGLICSEDIEQVAGPETCIKIGCDSSSECGDTGLCCKVSAGGNDVSICVPPSCKFAGCNVAP
ncbi:MAG: hypothetical protein ACI9OJ_001207 [Myxococcota bacterium]|jgi:hypothetical protein